MTIAVYKIRNVVNEHFYIGSSVQCEKRWRVHRRMLKNNKHHNVPLQRAWNKYGEAAFVFDVIIVCDRDELKSEESRLLEEYFGHSECYNTSRDPLAPTRGIKRSDETRKKISESLTGKVQSDHEREANRERQIKWNADRIAAGISHPNVGRKLSNKQKEHLRTINIGREISEMAKSILLDYAKKPKSDEHKRRIAESVRRSKNKQ